MALLVVIGLLLLGAAVALLLRAVALPRLRMEGHMRQIEAYGFGSDDSESLLDAQDGPGPLDAVAERAGRWAMRYVKSLKPLERRELLAAGIYDRSVEAVHGLRVMAAAGLPAMILAATLLGGSVSLRTIVALCALAALGWLLPAVMIRSRGRQRLDRIDAALPELIDVLTATIEAGLGFAGSLALCAERFDGPLGQELRLTLREQTMGLSTNAALENMRERCDTPSVRAFVRAVAQGESLGVSIGAMMRNLATETRKRRRASAQERIQKAPVKLLFPLIFLIFPALLIVLLYPALHNVLTTLNGG
ncbi:MAG TPA: type II secretion system F family protein [Solirubrobacteraceae bacterium]|nr:type II secretion system F family protein [Solirubrobacteraceae bacterium]